MRHARTLAAFLLFLALPPFSLHALEPEVRRQIEALGELLTQTINQPEPALRQPAVARIFDARKIGEVGEDRLLKALANLHQHLAPWQFHHAELVEIGTGDSLRLVLHVYGRAGGGWKDLQLRVSPRPPHRVTEIAFLADVAEPVYLPNGDITARETLDWLNSYVDRLARDNDLSASILVAQGSQILYERTVGFADAARTRPVTPASGFGMASGSKMLTALLLAQLAERGQLSWDDPIARFFPDFPDPVFAQRCRIRHLLSHTSGVKEYWTERFSKEAPALAGLSDFLPFIYREGVAFAPGERFDYSNSNFILAGLIAEKVAKADYFDLVQRQILKPLGMTATRFRDAPGAQGDMAEPLVRDEKGWRRAGYLPGGSSAGGALTTARDQLTFAQALLAGRIVSPETLAHMTAVHAKSEEGASVYGLGFELETGGPVRSFGHGGIAPGTNFSLRLFPDRQITLVVLGNQDNGAWDDLRRNLVKLITGER